MILASIALQVTISPPPKEANISGVATLAGLDVTCTYEDSGEQCKQHILDNYEFFKKILYPREDPYSKDDYYLKQIEPSVSTMAITIADSTDNYDIDTLNETYTIEVTATQITISAANGFALSRAFATLVQLVDAHPVLPEDHKAYSIATGKINDGPVYPWRLLLIDGARHYLSISHIKKVIDALAISKFNILHFHLIDDESFPLKFDNEPQSRLFEGAWHKKYYYSIADLKEIQSYAFTRGVFLFIEFEVPGHSTSWNTGVPEIMSKCPAKNTLNPIKEETYDLIKSALEELLLGPIFEQEQFSLRQIIHLGGDEVNKNCWQNDPQIKEYMDQHNMTPDTLWNYFHRRLNEVVNTVMSGRKAPLTVFWEESWNNHNEFTNNSIVHFWLSQNKNAACEKGLRTIESTMWYLPRAFPTGRGHYSFMDTWQDFYTADLKTNSDKCQNGQILGGGPAMWGEKAWGAMDSEIQHIFPRSLAAGEVLWSEPANRAITNEVRDRIDGLSCKLYQAGIKSGPIQPGAPCLGHPEF